MNDSLKGYRPDSERWPVLRHGSIFFKDRTIVCFVLNRSRGGAGLVLQSDVALPLVFNLEIDGENIRRRCVAVWRDQRRVGVSFDIDRLAQFGQHGGPVEEQAGEAAFAAFRPTSAVLQPVPLAREQSVARFPSILRFAALSRIYKAVLIDRAGAAAPHIGEPRLSEKT